MNALRNFCSRPLCQLRQSGQNAFLSFIKSPENVVPVKDDCGNTSINQGNLNNATSIFEHRNVDFIGKKFKTLLPSQLSPNTLKQCRRLERKVQIVYLCKLCKTRNNKLISELAYTSGVVILQCDGCGVDHLIKDNLGWFSNSNGKSFYDVLAEKGDYSIKVIKVDQNGELI